MPPAPKLQAASEAPAAKETLAASSPIARQDTVSLSGTLPPQQRQQSAPSHGNAQPATSAAQVTAGIQSPIATATAGAAATASPTSAPSAARPPQTLQQLDRVRQQLGIDPQTLSLISREGIVNWVNDPAALRQLVQNVQSAANTSQANDAVGAANPNRSTTQLSIASANQNQIQLQTQNQPQTSAGETSPASGSPSSSSAVSSANTNALDQSAATAPQNATAVMQFQKLKESLAPGGGQETQPTSSAGDTATPHGQLLNVSA